MRLDRLVFTDNINAVSVRLSLDACNTLRRVAFAKATTLSALVRKAIDEYCQKAKN